MIINKNIQKKIKCHGNIYIYLGPHLLLCTKDNFHPIITVSKDQPTLFSFLQFMFLSRFFFLSSSILFHLNVSFKKKTCLCFPPGLTNKRALVFSSMQYFSIALLLKLLVNQTVYFSIYLCVCLCVLERKNNPK